MTIPASPHRRVFAFPRFFLLCLCLAGTLHAQQPALFRLADLPAIPGGAATDAPEPHALEFGAVAAFPTEAGETVSFEFPGWGTVEAAILQYTEFPNGDRSWSAAGRSGNKDFVLSVTFGDERAFGNLLADGRPYRITARLADDGPEGRYVGRLFHEGESGGEDAGNPRKTASAVLARTVPDGESEAVETGGLRIMQDSAKSVYRLGERVRFEVELRNGGNAPLGPLTVTLVAFSHNYNNEAPNRQRGFELADVPEACEHTQTWLNAFELKCETDVLAAGGSANFSYSVRTYSTLGEGDYNLPASVNSHVEVNKLFSNYGVLLHPDILHDGDRDEISDFNEELLGSDPEDPLSRFDDNIVVDVLVYYTPGMIDYAAGAPESFINQIFNRANASFEQSGAGIAVRPAGMIEVEYPEAAPTGSAFDAMWGREGGFADLDVQRARHGADLVTLFRGWYVGEAGGACGIGATPPAGTQGFLMPFREYAFLSVMYASNCRIAFAHELGHNFGLQHSRRQDPEGGTFAHSVGYGVDGEFATLMAYPEAFGTYRTVEKFSSPDYTCMGKPCGIDPLDDAERSADAVSTLRAVRFQVADYYESRPVLALASLAGEAVDASLSGGVIGWRASQPDSPVPGGERFDNFFNGSYSLEDPLDLALTLHPDDGHVGGKAALHAVMHVAGAGFIQLGGDGSLSPWDGRVDSLLPFTEVFRLETSQDFVILEEFRMGDLPPPVLDAMIVDAEGRTPVRIFFGYNYDDGEDLVYTKAPILFHVRSDS